MRKVLSELREEIEFDEFDDELEEDDEMLDSLLSFESNEDWLYPGRSELS